MKSFSRNLALFLTPLAIILLGVNFIVDPGSLYRHNFEEAMATRLLAGEDVGINRNFDDRYLVRLLAQERGDSARLIVLGTSQSLELTADNFCLTPDEFWNASISGATMQDILGVIGTLYENDQLPERLLLEVTPRLLAGLPPSTRWQTLRREYEMMVEILGRTPLPSDPLKDKNLQAFQELFSPTYFQESISFALQGGLDTRQWFALNDRKATRLPQGAQLYPPALAPDPATVEKLASDYLEESPEWPAPDANHSQYLLYLVDQLSKWGIEVVVFLPPLHPLVYELQSANAPNQEKIYLDILNMLSGYGHEDERFLIRVLGGHNAAALGLDSTDFRDGVHLLKRSIDRYFTPLGCEWTDTP